VEYPAERQSKTAAGGNLQQGIADIIKECASRFDSPLTVVLSRKGLEKLRALEGSSPWDQSLCFPVPDIDAISPQFLRASTQRMFASSRHVSYNRLGFAREERRDRPRERNSL
jgi:hypothetical protein